MKILFYLTTLVLLISSYRYEKDKSNIGEKRNTITTKKN